MNRRLQQFLSAENISQAQLASTLGVARASISHILAGRNKPGFDFIESLARNYPSVNLDWLISGKGKMYKVEFPHKIIDNTLFPETDSIQTLDPDIQNDPEPSLDTETNNSVDISDNTIIEDIERKRISKIIILYSDGSYSEIK